MLLVFLLCNALLPVQRVVHEVHFGVAAILRESVSLNKLVNGGINAFWRWLDSWGATPTNFTLDPKHFQQVAANQDYRSLAKMCIAGLHGLHSVPSHTAYYHGIGDAWAFWIVIIQQCSVDSCVKPSHPYDLELMNLRNFLAWRGLSGSDDVLWACLALMPHSHFSDMQYHWNGARGVRQLYAEAEDHYVKRDGNHTELYWDTRHRYTATIGISLWITASAQLYVQTGEKRYISNALSAFDYLVVQGEYDTPLLTSHGHVYDGRNIQFRKVDRTEWSYNAGVALAALTGLYRVTHEERFLHMGERVAQHAMETFWGGGHLHEVQSLPLNTDQLSFKGLFLHYLADFLVSLRKSQSGQGTPDWVDRLRVRVEDTCTWLVHNRLTERRFCAYWGEHLADSRCKEQSAYVPAGMVGASQLFLLAHLLRNSSS